MDNANNIFERKNLDGSIDYVVNIGSFLYNNQIVSLSNIVIPIRQQIFFSLPDEKKYYAAVNVYYSVDEGSFVFDAVKKSSTYIDSCDSAALTNAVPIGQFIIQQTMSRFEVKKINLFSKMSTFSITDNFIQGDRGLQGEVGDTGFLGYTGIQGITGIEGMRGYTGFQGDTCIGAMGSTGMQGCTGIYHDLDLLMYLKFKADDVNLTDYSAYERDLLWGASGAGITGIVFLGTTGSVTGIEIINQGQSSYNREEGIVDYSHNVLYNGGRSGYHRNEYLGFTGTIHMWVNVDQPPIANFRYEGYTGTLGYPYKFLDESLYSPLNLLWEIDGTNYDSGVLVHTFGATGIYVVKLTASNAAGSHTKSRQVTVT